MDTRHIVDSATENFASPVHSLIASFVCHWVSLFGKVDMNVRQCAS